MPVAAPAATARPTPAHSGVSPELRELARAENAALFDFELTPDEMKAIDALDAGTRVGPDPDTITF